MADTKTSNSTQPANANAQKTASKEPAKVVKPVIKTLKKNTDSNTSSSTSTAPVAKPASNEATSTPAKKAAPAKAKKVSAKKKKVSAAPKKAAPVAKKKTVKTAPKKATVKKAVKKSVAKTKKTSPAKKATATTRTVKSAQPNLLNINPTSFNQMETLMTNNKNFEKMTQEAANIQKETAETVQKCMASYTKGMQDAMTTCASMMQTMAEKNSKLMKDMLAKKNVNEISEALQAASQDNFNESVANFSKLYEQTLKATMDSFEPLNQQINKNVKKATDSIAA